MSNHLTSLAYKVQIGSLLRKSVLVLLADKASDDGSGIYASKQTMADELCCSKQAVIKTIREFVNEGILEVSGKREMTNGHTVEYRLAIRKLTALDRVKRWASDQSTTFTGKRDAPVNDDDPTPTPRLPKPPLNQEDKSSLGTAAEELREAWNVLAAPFGAVHCNRLSGGRKAKLERLAKRYPVEDLTEAITAVGRSKFLTGRTTREYRAAITFLCSDEHMEKLLEGSYD